MPAVGVEGNACLGTLSIDSLGLTLPVLGDWTYARLKTAPCRFAGSCYEGGFVIARHNYRTHFGPLDRLAPGDRVVFTGVDGRVFEYEVAELQVLSPTAVEEMTDDGWDLSLFTCTLSGQARLRGGRAHTKRRPPPKKGGGLRSAYLRAGPFSPGFSQTAARRFRRRCGRTRRRCPWGFAGRWRSR